jgi:hypothetical protein
MCIIIFNMGEGNSCMRSWFKLELWVTSLSDTPRLQYYDVQTLEYRYISKLPMKKERFYETLHSCSTQPTDVHEGIPLLSKI